MAFKVLKHYKKFAVVKDDYYGKYYIVDVANSQTVYGSYWAGNSKFYAQKLDDGLMTVEDMSQYGHDYLVPIDMPKSLKAKQAQLAKEAAKAAEHAVDDISKPIGSTAPSIVKVEEKGTYKIVTLSDGKYGYLIPSTGESKLDLANKYYTNKTAKKHVKEHAASILAQQGIDPGDDATETLLGLYESRVREMYAQAAMEMADKQAAYIDRFARADAEMAAKHQAGEVTADELRRWRRTQSMVAAQNANMVEALSADLANANGKAMQMLNGYMPQAYAENYNFATFQIEKAANVSTSFSLYNQDVIMRLAKNPDEALLPPARDVPKDMAWCREKVSSCIAQSILQGDSVPRAAARLESVVGMGANSAVRAARTALTGASNLGRLDAGKRAKAMGIDLRKQWIATVDNRTRHTHRQVDRETVELEEEFSNGCMYPGDPTARGEEVWNCFLGETVAVPLGGIERSYKHLYRGDAVTVKTASGVEFTCTPNHPILTSEGWVAAGMLDDGDHLLVADLGNALGRPRVEPDVQHIGTRMDAIHELADMLASQRAGGLSVYFHEDIPTCDVDVVTEERPLCLDFETLRIEPRGEIRLKHTDPLAFGNCTEMEFAGRPPSPPDGLMGGESEPGALGWGSIRHALKHSLRAVPGRYSTPFESAVYETATDAKLVRDCLDGLSAIVKLDDVVDVHVGPVACHVYNLQTESGAYLVSGTGNDNLYAMSHNCRCAMRHVLPGHEYDDLPELSREGLEYEEWKNAKLAEMEANIDKYQAQLDKITAQKNKVKSALPEDKSYAKNEILKHPTSLSKWEQEKAAIADSEAYCEKKLNDILKKHYNPDDGDFDSWTWEDKADHYKKKLDAIRTFDREGKAYHEAYAAVKGQLDSLDEQAGKVQAKLQKAKGVNQFSQERLAAGRKFGSSREADDALRAISGNAWRQATSAERRAINTYTGNSYDEFNIPLNGYKGSYRNFVGLDKVDIDDLGRGQMTRDMTTMIERSIMEEDIWVKRGVGRRTMNTFFGMDPQTDITSLPESQLKSFVGMSNRIGSFQSCGTTFSTGFTNKPVSLEIFVPKGAEAMYVEPISRFGDGDGLKWDGKSKQRHFSGELETILQRGGSYTCIDFKYVGSKPTFVLEVHPEDGYWKFQQ